MAKIEWKSPIEAMHGKLFEGFGAAKRKSVNQQGEQPNFSVFYGKRSTTPGNAELANRTRFATLSAMYELRKADSAKRLADQAAFKNQSYYKTLRAYMWSKCADELAQQNS